MNKINQISTQDAIYIAGLFDGEGCISLLKSSRLREPCKTPTYVLRAMIKMCNKDIIKWLHITIGGIFYAERNPASRISRFPNSKPYCEWGVNGRNAIVFLKQIYPYLKVKRLQAEIAFKFGETIQSGYSRKLSDKIISQRQQLRFEMLKLNGRKVPMNLLNYY